MNLVELIRRKGLKSHLSAPAVEVLQHTATTWQRRKITFSLEADTETAVDDAHARAFQAAPCDGQAVTEGTFLTQFQPHSGTAAGGSAILRYNLLGFGRFVPFLDGGAGILHLDFDLRDQADGINFITQAGIGSHFFISERVALTGEWRYQHISNARINYPNRSINALAFFFGASIFLR